MGWPVAAKRVSLRAWWPAGNARVAPLRCTQAGALSTISRRAMLWLMKYDQPASGSGKDFLEGLEHERVDEHVVDGREVRAERHVVDVVIGLGGSERSVDELAVAAGKRDVPFREFLLEGAELICGEVVAEAARTAVRKECGVAVAEAERLGDRAQARIAADARDLALAKVVSTTVRAKLADLVVELCEAAVEELIEPRFQGTDGVVVSAMEGVFTSIRPLGWNSQLGADIGSGTLGDHAAAERDADGAGFLHRTLAASRACGDALADGVDNGAAGLTRRDGILGNIELKEAHRALDIHPDRAGVDVRGRDHDAADGSAVAAMCVGV